MVQLYCAAIFTNNYREGQARAVKLTEREAEIITAFPHILESYHYVGKQSYVEHMRRCGAKVFLDSGAFSAFHLKAHIDLKEYCAYIQDNSDIIRVEDGALMASVLDGIGDPLQTYRNQLEMEARGVRPLPCFHFGEDERYLEYYIQNYNYITIGGMVGKSTPQLMVWLDRIWNKYMVDETGKPRVKAHAFGITSFSIMEAYPWYSVDSSSWIQAAAFGNVMFPGHGIISISEKSATRHDAGRHVSTLSKPERDYIHGLLEENGFNYDRLCSVYESRAAWNVYAFGKLNAMINAEKGLRYRTQNQELF